MLLHDRCLECGTLTVVWYPSHKQERALVPLAMEARVCCSGQAPDLEGLSKHVSVLKALAGVPPTLFIGKLFERGGTQPDRKASEAVAIQAGWERSLMSVVTLDPHCRQLYEELRAVWRICAREWAAS